MTEIVSIVAAYLVGYYYGAHIGSSEDDLALRHLAAGVATTAAVVAIAWAGS